MRWCEFFAAALAVTPAREARAATPPALVNVPEHDRMTLWAPLGVIALGGFLASAPLAFDYGDAWLVGNDIVTGLLLVALGYVSISPRGGVARWGATAIGIWLMLAPLVFWAPTAAAYDFGASLAATAALGIALMLLPPLFGVEGAAAESNWLFGPLIVTFAVIAMADVARPVRFVNLPLAVLAALAPFVLGDLELGYALLTLAAAASVIVISLPRGAVGERYAGWTERIA